MVVIALRVGQLEDRIIAMGCQRQRGDCAQQRAPRDILPGHDKRPDTLHLAQRDPMLDRVALAGVDFQALAQCILRWRGLARGFQNAADLFQCRGAVGYGLGVDRGEVIGNVHPAAKRLRDSAGPFKKVPEIDMWRQEVWPQADGGLKGLFRSIRLTNTAEKVGGLTSTDLGALTITQLGGLSSTRLGALKTTQIGGLTTTQIAALTTTQLGGLTANEIGALTTTQMGGLTTTQLAAFTVTQIRGFTTTDLAALTTTQFGGLTSTEIGALTTGQIAGLTTTQITNLRVRPETLCGIA